MNKPKRSRVLLPDDRNQAFTRREEVIGGFMSFRWSDLASPLKSKQCGIIDTRRHPNPISTKIGIASSKRSGIFLVRRIVQLFNGDLLHLEA